MRRLIKLAIATMIIGACSGAVDESTDDGIAGLATMSPGTQIRIEGEVSLFGELFCPCFVISADGASAVIWYDLMADRDPVPANEVAALHNGALVRVEGEVQAGRDAGSNDPVVWASHIRVQQAGLANPASVACEEAGGTLEMRTNQAGTAGWCIFDDGTECEEWSYFYGECGPGRS